MSSISASESIVFGEHGRHLPPDDDRTIRVYIDKNGDYYPPHYFISDKELIASGGSVANWYKSHHAAFEEICRQNGNAENPAKQKNIADLNDAICRQLAEKINKASDSADAVYLLIHGFRKRAYKKPDPFTYLASTDNQILKEKMDSLFKPQRHVYIELYWDACYTKPTISFTAAGLSIFEKRAMPNAERAGLSLRKLIAMLKVPQLNILAHSLGARLACNMMFNMVIPGGSTNTDAPLNKKIKACLMAPALSSANFQHFYERPGGALVTANDDYELCIVYNAEDYMLKKGGSLASLALGPRTPADFGDTSLGCNYQNDIGRLKQIFAEKFPYTKTPGIIELTGDKRITNHLISAISSHPAFNQVHHFFS